MRSSNDNFYFDFDKGVIINEADGENESNGDASSGTADSSNGSTSDSSGTDDSSTTDNSSDDSDSSDTGDSSSEESESDDSDNSDDSSDDFSDSESDDSDFDIDTDDVEDDSGDDAGGDDSVDSSGDSGDGPEIDKDSLKAKDGELYDELSPAEQKLKNRNLKKLFLDMFSNCNNIIDKFNSLSSDMQESSEQIKNSMNVLLNLKLMISDYLLNIFDSKSFIENDIMYNRYLAVLNSIKNITKDLKNVYKDDN